MSIQIKNTVEKYLNGEVKITNSVPYVISNYIRCRGEQMENVLGRIRLAFVRCPNCREHMGIYKDEISNTGQTRSKKCPCGFKNSLILKNW